MRLICAWNISADVPMPWRQRNLMLASGSGFSEVSMIGGMEEIESRCSPSSGQSNATYRVFGRSPNIASGMGIVKDQAISRHAGKLHRAQTNRTQELLPTSMKDCIDLFCKENNLIVPSGQP